MDFVHSEKKHEKLIDGGYLYLVDKRSTYDPGVVYWRCEMYRKEIKCLARVHTKDGKIVKRSGTHGHQPNFSRVEALKVVREIKEKALASTGGPREIIAAGTADLSPEVVALLPSAASLCRAIQRDRLRAAQGSVSVPVLTSQEQWDTNNDEGREQSPTVEGQSSHSLQTDTATSDSCSADHDLDVWKDEQMNIGEFEEKPRAVQGPILEIHTAKLTTAGMWGYREVSQKMDYVTTRASFADTVLGHWTTAGHRVNQVTQLIQYDNVVEMLSAQRAMESSSQWREQCRCLESSLLSSHSVLTVLAPQSQLCCQFESAEEAVYEMQTLPEQNCPVVLGSEATLVGRFLPLYGPSKIEYRLLRYPDPDSAFAAAYHSLQSLPSGSDRQLLIPLPTSMLH